MGQAHNMKGFRPECADAKVSYLPIKDSQTLAVGDCVIIDTGQIAIGVAGSAVLAGVVAQKCTSLAAGTLVAVWADPDTVFVGVGDADGSSLVMGGEADLIGATGAQMIDVSESTTDVFKLLAVHPDDAAATALQRWRLKINKHAFAQID